MTTKTVKLSYLSDNQIRFTLRAEDGNLIKPDNLWVKVYLRSGDRTFTAVNDPFGADTKNCHIDGDTLVVDVPSRKLYIGKLEYMIEVRVDSSYFSDGYKNIFSGTYQTLNIELV